MTITAEDLGAYLGAVKIAPRAAGDVIDTAGQLIAQELGSSSTIPETIRDQATLIVAAELWRRRDAPGGVVNAWGDTTVPVRLARDPLTPARPLLAPWTPPGVA